MSTPLHSLSFLRRFFSKSAVVACALLAGLCFAQPAAAQGTSFTCSGGSPSGNMFDVANVGSSASDTVATATGYSGETITLSGNNTSTTTSTNGNIVGIFASVLSYFRTEVGQIMSSMYCSVQNALIGPLGVLSTLFVVVFGILITTGMSRLTIREGATMLFKLALVWTFAMNADWGIGVAYRFFMGVAEEGSNIVLQAICGGSTSVPLLDQPDTLFSSIFNLISGATTAANTTISMPNNCLNLGNAAPATNSLSTLPQACAGLLMSVFGMMTFLSPALTSFAAIMVFQYIGLYARALLGYLTSLVIISFLFILSPIFISFALFKITQPLFEKWIGHLASYSVQMIIIFGFLALLALVAGQLTNSLLGLVSLLREYDITLAVGNVHQPMHVCSICAYNLAQGSNNGLPTVTCGGSAGGVNDTVTGTDGSQVIPIMNLFHHQDFIIWALSQTLAWWLIAFVLQEFLKNAPKLAHAIAGAPYGVALLGSGQLGGDIPSMNFPGAGALGAAGSGLQGWWKNATLTRGALGGTLGAIGLSKMFGARTPGAPDGGVARPAVSGMRTTSVDVTPTASGGMGGGGGGSTGGSGGDDSGGFGPGRGGAAAPAVQGYTIDQKIAFGVGEITQMQMALARITSLSADERAKIAAELSSLYAGLKGADPSEQSIEYTLSRLNQIRNRMQRT